MDHPLDGVENQGGRSVSAVATTSGANDGKKEKKGRAKHTCPFQSCSANIVHFPRHMMQVHKWQKKTLWVSLMHSLYGNRRRVLKNQS